MSEYQKFFEGRNNIKESTFDFPIPHVEHELGISGIWERNKSGKIEHLNDDSTSIRWAYQLKELLEEKPQTNISVKQQILNKIKKVVNVINGRFKKILRIR